MINLLSPVGLALQILLGSVAFNDFLYGRIEHRSVGALLALYGIACFEHQATMSSQVGVWFLIFFAAGVALFYGGLWGGGDAKLFPVLSVWAFFPYPMIFVYEMAFLGGLMALIWVGWHHVIQKKRLEGAFLFRQKIFDSEWVGFILPSALKQRHEHPTVFHLPYGVPMAVALWLHLLIWGI